jgi:hypothetical protein
MSRRHSLPAAILIVFSTAGSASSAPSGFWCFLIDGDRNNSVCSKRQDHCELGRGAARQLSSATTECSHYDTVWSTHYKMGDVNADWFYVTKDQCETMRELFDGTACKEKR